MKDFLTRNIFEHKKTHTGNLKDKAMETITNLLTSRAAAFIVGIITPLLIAGQNWVGAVSPDAASKVNTGAIAEFLASLAVGGVLYFTSHKFGKNKEGVRAIQEKISESPLPVNAKIDGIANPNGETVKAVGKVLKLAEEKTE